MYAGLSDHDDDDDDDDGLPSLIHEKKAHTITKKGLESRGGQKS